MVQAASDFVQERSRCYHRAMSCGNETSVRASIARAYLFHSDSACPQLPGCKALRLTGLLTWASDCVTGMSRARSPSLSASFSLLQSGSIDLSADNTHSGDRANYSFLWRHDEVGSFRADAKGTPTLRFERALSRSQTLRSTLRSMSSVVISQVIGWRGK